MVITCGTMYVTACKANIGMGDKIVSQSQNATSIRKGIRIENIIKIRILACGKSRAHAEVIAGPKAPIVPRLHHPNRPLARDDFRLNGFEGAITTVVVYDNQFANWLS